MEEPWIQLQRAPSHPHIWKKSILRTSPNARPGDLVRLYGPEQEGFGSGLYAPRSQIAIRWLSRDGLADTAWLAARLDEAIALRRDVLALDADSEAYRILHGEGDGFPGLVIDRYGPLLSVELHSEGWISLLPDIVHHLESRLETTCAILRADRRAQEAERFRMDERIRGEVPKRLIIQEHGLRFEIDPRSGHKTGFFCDQRENRRLLASFAKGKTVLDTFSFTGGFAIAADDAGATEVTAVELDEEAATALRRNANLNEARIKIVRSDVFPYLRQMGENGRRFDIVILDPPKFIPDRKTLEEGTRKYLDLNRLAIPLVAPGGLLVSSSCSGLLAPDVFVDVLRRAAYQSDPSRAVQLLRLTGASPDHPVRLDCPESSYLKVAWLRVV